jgi:SAM-dependent methyltransferase
MRNVTNNRHCAVCGSAEHRVTFRQPLILPENRCTYAGYDVVTCAKCGFVYADTGWSQSASDAHYAGPTKVALTLSEEGESEQDILRANNALKAIMPLVSRTHRIFDVGCGTARLLGLLKQRGYEQVLGIEQSPVSLEIARAKYGVPVIQGSIFDYEGQRFDLVVVCHVLEHIVDLSRFLVRLRELIHEDGIVYIEVPNATDFSRFADPRTEGEWIYIRDLYTHFSPGHVNFFSPVSLRNIMKRFGFEEVFCRPAEHCVITSAWKHSSFVVDSETEAEIGLYAQRSEQLQRQALDVIAKLERSGRKILVWGAGLHTQRLLARDGLGRANVVAFIDSDPTYQGGELAGRPIIAPAEIQSIDGRLPILVSSWKAQSAILANIKALALPNEIISLY